jgi:hypothetical protein
MRRLRYVSALASLLDLHGAADRLPRQARVMQHVAAHPELARARACALLGPWAVPPDAFEAAHLASIALC